MKILALRVFPWAKASRLPQRIDSIKNNIAKHVDYSEITIEPVYALGYYLGYILGFILAIPRLLKQNYDVLLVENSYLVVFGLISRLSRRKVIAEYVDYYPNMLKRIYLTRRLRYYVAILLCKIFSNLAHFVVVETRQTQRGVTNLGIPRSKVHVISHSPDSNLMKYRGREAIRDKYRIKEEDFVVGYVGKIPDHYNLEIIPKTIAIAQLRTEKNIIFLMVGDGISLPGIKKLSKDLNLRKSIFPGKIPYEEVPKYYSAFDVLLFTIKAPAAIKLIETMLVGTPVIAGYGYATEYIKDNVNGLVAKGQQPKDYAEKLIELISLPESEIKSMRTKIQQYAYKEFAYSYQKYLKLFNQLYFR
ncbi:MAG: glycosyltransferase [Candidatus Hodarchaeales archaeon]|jgi:glycosyltransferase involved in cell wall biosynthesis